MSPGKKPASPAAMSSAAPLAPPPASPPSHDRNHAHCGHAQEGNVISAQAAVCLSGRFQRCLCSLRPIRRVQERNTAGIAIYRYALSALQPFCCGARAQHCRNMVLACHDRAVTQRAAYIGNYTRRQGKERRPGRRRDSCDQDVTAPHLAEFIGAMQHPSQARHTPRAARNTMQRRARRLIAAFRHHGAKVNTQEARTTFQRQCYRRLDRSLAFPGCPPLGDSFVIRQRRLSPVECCCCHL